MRDPLPWGVGGKIFVDVGKSAVAGVLLVGAIAAQLLAGFMDRRSRREEDTPMRKLDFVVSSIMVVAGNAMISISLTVASTGPSCQHE